MASSLYSALMEKSTSHDRAVLLSESDWSKLFDLIERWHDCGGDRPPDDVDRELHWLVEDLLQNACNHCRKTKRISRHKPQGGVSWSSQCGNLLQSGEGWEIRLLDTHDRMRARGPKKAEARLIKATKDSPRSRWQERISWQVWCAVAEEFHAVERAAKPKRKKEDEKMRAMASERDQHADDDLTFHAEEYPIDLVKFYTELEAMTPARRELFPTVCLADAYRADRLNRALLCRVEHLAITRSGVLLSELLDAIDLARQTDPTLPANDLRRSVARRPMLQDEFGRIAATLGIPLASPPAKTLTRLKEFVIEAHRILRNEPVGVSQADSTRRLHVKGTSK